MAAPLTAAITGWCSLRSARMTSSSTSIDRSANVGRVSPSMCGTEPADLWSAPEENPRPAPVSTTARTELSWVSSSSTPLSGTMTSNAIEFIRSGRFSVTSATFGPRAVDEDESSGSVTDCTLSRAPAQTCRSPLFCAAIAASMSNSLTCCDQVLERRRWQRPGLVEHQLALLERHQRRDGADVGGGGELLLGLGVDLGVHDVGMLLRRTRRTSGRTPYTGRTTTPRSPPARSRCR